MYYQEVHLFFKYHKSIIFFVKTTLCFDTISISFFFDADIFIFIIYLKINTIYGIYRLIHS